MPLRPEAVAHKNTWLTANESEALKRIFSNLPASELHALYKRVEALPSEESQFFTETLVYEEFENIAPAERLALIIEIVEGLEYSVEKQAEQEAREADEAAAREARRVWIADAADRIAAAASDAGASVYRSYSNLSEAVYLKILTDEITLKIRIADHDPSPSYERLNGASDVMIGRHNTARAEGFGEDVDAAIAYIVRRIGEA